MEWAEWHPERPSRMDYVDPDPNTGLDMEIIPNPKKEKSKMRYSDPSNIDSNIDLIEETLQIVRHSSRVQSWDALVRLLERGAQQGYKFARAQLPGAAQMTLDAVENSRGWDWI